MGFKSNWQTAPVQEVADYFAIIQSVSYISYSLWLSGFLMAY